MWQLVISLFIVTESIYIICLVLFFLPNQNLTWQLVLPPLMAAGCVYIFRSAFFFVFLKISMEGLSEP